MASRIEVPGPGFVETFRNPAGLLGQYLFKRAQEVAVAAKRQVGVRTGNLRASIYASIGFGPTGDLMARVGSDLAYAESEDKGTPPHVIRPKNARVLRWTNKQGEVVYALHVNHPGTNPNHYLGDNLPIAIR